MAQKKKNSALRLIARRADRPGSSLRALDALPCTLLLLAGLTQGFCAAFPSVAIPFWQLLLGQILLCCLLLPGYHSRVGGYLVPAGCLLLAVICFCFFSQMRDSCYNLYNDFLDFLTKKTGEIYLNYAVSSGSTAAFATIVLSALSALLCSRAAWSGRILALLPLLLPGIFAGCIGFLPLGYGTALLAGGVLLIFMRRTVCFCGDTAPKRLVGGQLLLLFLSAALAAGVAYTCRDVPSTALLTRVKEQLHSARYDHDTNSMPEGALANLSAWNKSDTAALAVTMEEPEKLYLRGAIYETYTGTAWEPLSTETRADSEDLFYWLHASGFYGQSQIAAAAGFTALSQPKTMTVRNLSACSAVSYLPYALAGSDVLDARLIGDAKAVPSGAVQTFLYLSGSLPEWYGIQQMISANQSRTNLQQYLSLEQSYQDYVLSQDLQLTQDSWAVLQRQLGGDGTDKTLQEIRETIRSYLSDHLSYDETVVTHSGSSDFLHYVLEGSGSGYSVHYATAAVLMLRYYGVPARYVEGYFLSAEDAAAVQAGETVTLTEENAHAWAEYYLRGVGFVPFEVTPGYLDDEEKDLGGQIALSEETYSGNSLAYAQVQQPEAISEEPQDRLNFRFQPAYLFLLLFFAILALLAVFTVRRQRLRRALQRIDRAEPKDAVTLRYGYAVMLLRRCGVSPPERAEEAANLNREAMFSSHPITQLQKQQMDAFTDSVLSACKENLSFLKRLRYRVIDCLY